MIDCLEELLYCNIQSLISGILTQQLYIRNEQRTLVGTSFVFFIGTLRNLRDVIITVKDSGALVSLAP